jgi:hypothetical protein
MRNRSGATSLAELLLVTVLFAFVLAALARAARDQNRLAALQHDRLRYEEAVRTAAVILGAELRLLTDADIPAMASDSVRIRAFRGGGAVCISAEDGIRVRYRGTRLPDPERDSVLIVWGTREDAYAVQWAAAAPDCGGALHLRLDRSAEQPGGYALVFETGAYTLTDGAVRYRRGQGGRQPLTEALLGDMAFESGPMGFLIRLDARPDSLPRLPAGGRTLRVSRLQPWGAP